MPQKSGCLVSRRAIRNASATVCGAVLWALWGAAANAYPALPALWQSQPEGARADPRRPLTILAQAQSEPASFRASNASGAAGRAIPLNIEILGPTDKSAGQLFVFSGLPKGVTLQPGGFFGDFWAVNASVIDELTLTAPASFSGSFTVWITRSRNQAGTAQSASITVTIGEPATTPTAATAAAAPARETAAAPAHDSTAGVKPRTGGSNETMLMARANQNFEKGDVSGARVIYEYLAMQGSSAAAMAMGETYDPLVLAKLVVKGLDADPKKAQQWYEKAEELGSQEARSRLNALAAR
jgi:hypothetical protein